MAFRKILVGIDLHQGDRLASQEVGPASRTALTEAVDLALHSGGTVTFCTALNISTQTATLINHDPQNLFKTVEDFAAVALDQIVAEATAKGVTADKVVRFGQPGDELAKLAHEGRYDLVIVGTRTRSKTSQLIFGSTAQKVMRAAPCAVWVVKPEITSEIREIAVATDLTESCRPAMTAAVKMARALDAKLFVVHAVESAELSSLLVAGISPDTIQMARVKLTEDALAQMHQHLMATDYRTLAHGVKVELLDGPPDDVIPQFVIDNEIDVLVLGTHARSGISRLVLGNTAERILPTVHCSVLAVKPGDFVSPYATDK
ncbi:MAG TPA: universal stress protein [Schlesneria sp.]|jgi:universal stress protein E